MGGVPLGGSGADQIVLGVDAGGAALVRVDVDAGRSGVAAGKALPATI